MNIQNLFQKLVPWLLSHGIKIVLIIIAAFLANLFLRIFIKKAVKRIIGDRIRETEKKRERTLISVFSGTAKFVIGIVAFLMVLPEFGVNIGVLLAGVGIIGLAIGMASKEIISDFLSGFFIILENQYLIGDEIEIAGIKGEVKEITLRKTIIKDETGSIHLIPNRQVKTVAKKINEGKKA